jgi:hypothetical protein
MSASLYVLCAFMFVLPFGCTTIEPRNGPAAPEIGGAGPFSHELFDHLLSRVVDDEGLVDYAALKDNPRELDAYYRLLSRTSPNSHPQRFPHRDDRLAYWINAYNAAVLRTVMEYYPIVTVGEVKPPWLFFFMPERSGFFYFQRPIFGGEEISLYNLEHEIVRPRFGDARIHFALNCASAGCPRLPTQAFQAAELEDQLNREARRFVSERRNVFVDDEKREIRLSSIFKWYEEDFEAAVDTSIAVEHGAVLEYIGRYLPAEKAHQLRQASTSYGVVFTPYDWSLNDRRRVSPP